MKPSVSGMKHPVARPPKNCIIKGIGRLVQNGVSNEITAKPIEAAINTRRGPKAAASQIETRVINIWAEVCAVVIQAPSSNPAPTAPRISDSPKVDSRPLRVEMNVPSSTPRRPSQGIFAGGVIPCGETTSEGVASRGVLIFATRRERRCSPPLTDQARADRQVRPRRQ